MYIYDTRSLHEVHSLNSLTISAKQSVRSKDDVDDDDGLPNTYDYNDSFINDDDAESESSSPADSDSDFDPEDSQDLDNLKKEAKKFLRNKRQKQKL